jgi:hypothetical protein
LVPHTKEPQKTFQRDRSGLENLRTEEFKNRAYVGSAFGARDLATFDISRPEI